MGGGWVFFLSLLLFLLIPIDFLYSFVLAVLFPVESRRGVKRYLGSYLKELYKRRLLVGPEKLRHRSEWINW